MPENQPFLEDLRRAVAESGSVPEPISLWLKKIDEEIALVTWILALEHGDQRKFLSKEALSSITPPLGYGRSTREIIEELDRSGVVKAAPPDSFDDYTHSNPSLEFGRMYYWILHYMQDVGLLKKEDVHEKGSRMNNLVSRYGYFGYGIPKKTS